MIDKLLLGISLLACITQIHSAASTNSNTFTAYRRIPYIRIRSKSLDTDDNVKNMNISHFITSSVAKNPNIAITANFREPPVAFKYLKALFVSKLNPFTAKLLLLLCSVCYASNYSTTKHLQATISPSVVTFLRFAIGSIYFVPSIIRMQKSREVILRAMELGVWAGIGFIQQAISLRTTPAGKVSIFSSLSVVMPPFYNMLFNKKVDKKYTNLPNIISSPFVAPVIAMLGACVLEWGGLESPTLTDLSLLITPIAFSMTFWRSEMLASSQNSSDIMKPITGLLLISTALVSLIWSIVEGEFPLSMTEIRQLGLHILSDRNLMIGLFITSVMATAWTSLMEQYALRVISAADMTLMYSMEPIFASIFAWWMMNEPITANVIVGGIFVIIACVWDSKRDSIIHLSSSQK